MRLGIDLGGTKIETIALTDNGQEVFKYRVDTPQGDYAQTVIAIVQLVEQTKKYLLQHGLSSASDKLTIGIGIPGAVSLKTGLIKNANSVCLIGQPLQADLQRKLGQSVRINNDANCFTVSEATDGAAAGCEVIFGVIIGTGTGGGIAIRQQVVSGVNAIAGEWGHNPMPWLSKSEIEAQPVPCYCGQHNCIETFLSGPGMLRRFRQAGGLADSPEEIAARANNGDQQAEQFMKQYDNWLAKGLASIINILDPDVIVLGGGLSNIDRLYRNVPKLWQQYVFSDQVNTKLLKAKYSDSSGVRGAAWLWPADDKLMSYKNEEK